MSLAVSLAMAALAAAAAAVLGWVLGGRRGVAQLEARVERAEQALKEEAGRASAKLAAVEVQARRDVAAVQDEMLARIERLQADHRAESEKLAAHLTEAYDELDRLRHRSVPAQPGDTGQGFPATMPLGDL